jgi:non-specific serine/threonine protein kinase
VGRRAELAEIRRLLSATRLLTLTGVGGVGKTRLALRVAAQVRRSFADGVRLVELAGLPDPALLPQAVATALGMSDQTARDQVEVLAEFLAGRQLLLVLDNCEHLLPAVARLTAGLLRAAPYLRVLATSREALQVSGEYLYRVGPLSVPEVGRSVTVQAALRHPGVALFAERATAVDPRFTLTDDNVAQVAGLCRRLDGIPLAIELAAARLRSMAVAQVADRLDDRFRLLASGNRAALARQQTLRAAMDWSFELCGKPERLVWIRAAVFAGSFDLPAAERVCGGDCMPPGEVLEALAGLVGKSVLVAEDHHDGRRYRLLETLRQYGLDRLREPELVPYLRGVDEPVLRHRHRDFYLELAERFHADWFGPRQVSWSRQMRAELANLRAALDFCLHGPDRDRSAVRLAGALHYLWYACGRAREGRLWLAQALAVDPQPSPERMRALAAYTRITLLQGQFDAAADLAHEGLELARRFHDPAQEAEALTILGIGHLARNKPAQAVALLRQAAAVAGELDRAHPQVAYANVPLAVALLSQDEAQQAGELLAESQQICRTHGDQWYLGLVLFNSARQALALSDTAQALAYGRESLRLRQALHDAYGAGSGLEVLAWIAAADHDHVRSARLLGAADEQWRATGGSMFSDFQAAQEARTTTLAALGKTAFDAEYRRGRDLTLDDAFAYALGHQHPPGTGKAPHAGDDLGLTRRESEIAGLVAEGLTNKQIASRLVISQRTVESHVENILTKLGFTTRTQIASWHTRRSE